MWIVNSKEELEKLIKGKRKGMLNTEERKFFIDGFFCVIHPARGLTSFSHLTLPVIAPGVLTSEYA